MSNTHDPDDIPAFGPAVQMPMYAHPSWDKAQAQGTPESAWHHRPRPAPDGASRLWYQSIFQFPCYSWHKMMLRRQAGDL